LRSPEPETAVCAVAGAELLLSGTALLDLMRQVLARGLPFRFAAKGYSMLPFIRDGDVIWVSPLKGARPGVGMVVAFVHPELGALTVHRIVARKGRAYLMQGDNAGGVTDGMLSEDRILGRVTRVERRALYVRLGLGPERYLIAFLSRMGWLMPLYSKLTHLLRPILRRLGE
jgi:hypothetical protein